MILERSSIKPIEMSKIINQSYLFGRLCGTFNGFHVQELGRLRLDSDGSVNGYKHSAEAAWKPLDLGFYFLDKSTGDPTSRWVGEYEGMLLGYYNHTSTFPHNLCLIPDISPGVQPHVIYVIASCLQFYKVTIPKLLAQFRCHGVRPQDIKVVVNDSVSEREETHDGVAFRFTTHRAYEISALYIAPVWDYDYALMIHDTCDLSEDFMEKSRIDNCHFQWEIISGSPRGRGLIGFYKRDFLVRVNDHLNSLSGVSKRMAINRELSAELILRAKSVLSRPNVSWLHEEITQPFGKARRFRVDYHSLGLRKYVHQPGQSHDQL